MQNSTLEQISNSTLPDLVKEILFLNFSHPYIIINHNGRIVHTSGDLAPYMQHSTEEDDINKIINPAIAKDVSTIIQTTLSTNQPKSTFCSLSNNQIIKIQLLPIPESDYKLYIIVFESIEADLINYLARTQTPQNNLLTDNQQLTPESSKALSAKARKATQEESKHITKIGSWELSRNLKDVVWSEETFLIYGYEPNTNATECLEDLLGRMQAQEKEKFNRMISIAVKNKRAYNYDIKVITPQNEVKYAQHIGRPVLDEKEKVVKLRGTVIDITERKLAEEKLKSALQQKEVLLKEVYHRVKNNLAMVEGLLFLQKNLISDQRYIDIFDGCEKRIHSMALVHRNLYQTENLDTIDIKSYIKELVQHIAMSSSLRNQVNFDIKINAIHFDLNKAIPLGLITNELVTNSLKYAFKDIADPKISISLLRHAEGYVFVIKDNGTGFEIEPEKERKTLGISLVNMLTSDLGGEITFDTQKGTKVKIVF